MDKRTKNGILSNQRESLINAIELFAAAQVYLSNGKLCADESLAPLAFHTMCRAVDDFEKAVTKVATDD